MRMIVSLAEAAQLTGKSRQTLYRKAKKGELLVTTREDNSKGVDTSELERVFGAITVQEATAQEATVQEASRQGTDVAELQRELASARGVLQRHQETIDELKADNRKLWDQFASQQQLLERNEQTVNPTRIQRFTTLSKIVNEGALFGLGGVCIGAIFFVLVSAL